MGVKRVFRSCGVKTMRPSDVKRRVGVRTLEDRFIQSHASFREVFPQRGHHLHIYNAVISLRRNADPFRADATGLHGNNSVWSGA